MFVRCREEAPPLGRKENVISIRGEKKGHIFSLSLSFSLSLFPSLPHVDKGKYDIYI